MADAITENMLQTVVDAEGEISEIDVKSFCEEGENFAAKIKEIKFKFRDSSTNEESRHSVILKYPSDPGFIFQLMMLMRAYERETKAYSDFFPNIEKWQKMKFGEILYKVPLPKCFYSDNEKYLFIMENLKNEGFSIEDSRLEGMNYEQSKSVMVQLGIFHALSYAYINNRFNTKKEFDDKYEYLKTTREAHDRTMEILGIVDQIPAMFHIFTSALIAKYPSEKEIFEKIQARIVGNSLTEQVYSFFTESPDFNVVCHGDLWGNNILFRREANGDIKTMFVDLQAVKYTTPAADLVHFFWISASENVLSNHMEELIHLYFTSFAKILKDLKCKLLFTFPELLDSVKYMHIMGFWRFILHCLVTFAPGGNMPMPSKNADKKEKEEVVKKNIENLLNAGEARLNHCLFRTRFATSLGIFK